MVLPRRTQAGPSRSAGISLPILGCCDEVITGDEGQEGRARFKTPSRTKVLSDEGGGGCTGSLLTKEEVKGGRARRVDHGNQSHNILWLEFSLQRKTSSIAPHGSQDKVCKLSGWVGIKRFCKHRPPPALNTSFTCGLALSLAPCNICISLPDRKSLQSRNYALFFEIPSALQRS